MIPLGQSGQDSYSAVESTSLCPCRELDRVYELARRAARAGAHSAGPLCGRPLCGLVCCARTVARALGLRAGCLLCPGARRLAGCARVQPGAGVRHGAPDVTPGAPCPSMRELCARRVRLRSTVPSACYVCDRTEHELMHMS